MEHGPDGEIRAPFACPFAGGRGAAELSLRGARGKVVAEVRVAGPVLVHPRHPSIVAGM